MNRRVEKSTLFFYYSTATPPLADLLENNHALDKTFIYSYNGIGNFTVLKNFYGVVISDTLGYLDKMAFIVKESLIEGARFIDYGFDPNKTLKGLKGIDLFEGIMSKITIYSEKMFAQLFQKKNVYRYFRDKLFR